MHATQQHGDDKPAKQALAPTTPSPPSHTHTHTQTHRIPRPVGAGKYVHARKVLGRGILRRHHVHRPVGQPVTAPLHGLDHLQRTAVAGRWGGAGKPKAHEQLWWYRLSSRFNLCVHPLRAFDKALVVPCLVDTAECEASDSFACFFRGHVGRWNCLGTSPSSIQTG